MQTCFIFVKTFQTMGIRFVEPIHEFKWPDGRLISDDEMESDIEMAISQEAFEYAALCQRELDRRMAIQMLAFAKQVFEALSDKSELSIWEVSIHRGAADILDRCGMLHKKTKA